MALLTDISTTEWTSMNTNVTQFRDELTQAAVIEL